MKKLFIVANWKSYKTQKEAMEWLNLLGKADFSQYEIKDKEVILCPPFPLLPLLHDLITNSFSNSDLLLRLGCQNISEFEEGAYTGEVSAKLISEFCHYAIIGHSERRTNFNEADDMLSRKVTISNRYNITPIFCIQGKETIIPEGVDIVAYEPISAIGTGRPDDPSDAEEVARYVKENHKVNTVLYGGSVDENDVKLFTSLPNIAGVLVGGASRDADRFSKIIKNG